MRSIRAWLSTPPVGTAGMCLCAAIGAYLATTATIALFMLAATAYQGVMLYLWARLKFYTGCVRLELEREVRSETRLLAAGRTAETMRMLVIGGDGYLFAGSLLELIEDRPDGGMWSWDRPHFVRIYYVPDGLKAEFSVEPS